MNIRVFVLLLSALFLFSGGTKAYGEITPKDEYRLACRGAEVKKMPYSEQKAYFPGKYVLTESKLLKMMDSGSIGMLTMRSFGNEVGGLWLFQMVFNPDIAKNEEGYDVFNISPGDKKLIRTSKILDSGIPVSEWRFKRYKSQYKNTLYFSDDGQSFGFYYKNEGVVRWFPNSPEVCKKLKERLQKYIDAGWCE